MAQEETAKTTNPKAEPEIDMAGAEFMAFALEESADKKNMYLRAKTLQLKAPNKAKFGPPKKPPPIEPNDLMAMHEVLPREEEKRSPNNGTAEPSLEVTKSTARPPKKTRSPTTRTRTTPPRSEA